MNYYQRNSLINTVNDGNHINQPPDDVSRETLEKDTIPCDQCGRDIDAKDHYRDGGLCFKCIERIGK